MAHSRRIFNTGSAHCAWNRLKAHAGDPAMKVVINRRYGGFGLSSEAKTILALRGVDVDKIDDHDNIRSNPDVVEVVERLGKLADGDNAELKVVEVPDDVK